MTEKRELEKLANEIGKIIASTLDDKIGFALLIFDFWGKGNLAWISNAQRQDMIKALGEFIEKEGVA